MFHFTTKWNFLFIYIHIIPQSRYLNDNNDICLEIKVKEKTVLKFLNNFIFLLILKFNITKKYNFND